MADTIRLGGNGEIFPSSDLAFQITGIRDELGQLWDFTGKDLRFDIRGNDLSDIVLLGQDALIYGSFDPNPAINSLTARVEFTQAELALFRPATYRYSWKCTESGEAAPIARGDFIVESVTQH